MPEKSVKSVRFSNGKPASRWRKPTHISFVVMVAVATLLGVWLYMAKGSAASTPPTGDTTPDAVQTVLRAGKPTIIEFGANNCVSCREMKPILHALALDPRIAVADVDILKESGYISKYQIHLMPTQVFYNAQGVEIGRHMGKISAEDILVHLGVTQAGVGSTTGTTKAAL
ncbi:thioredoxin family protein [Rhodoferax sp.]|uniref:thioredoxin family protein n=1 Tax=Rhodoferax sp. TaxID=50421 RepID=UPI0028411936|nr:thioredoxin family protein [Rhodoferax sp.]MDR3368895.1 thioredoxin family protein [Rhodoferax sp.]